MECVKDLLHRLEKCTKVNVTRSSTSVSASIKTDTAEQVGRPAGCTRHAETFRGPQNPGGTRNKVMRNTELRENRGNETNFRDEINGKNEHLIPKFDSKWELTFAHSAHGTGAPSKYLREDPDLQSAYTGKKSS